MTAYKPFNQFFGSFYKNWKAFQQFSNYFGKEMKSKTTTTTKKNNCSSRESLVCFRKYSPAKNINMILINNRQFKTNFQFRTKVVVIVVVCRFYLKFKFFYFWFLVIGSKTKLSTIFSFIFSSRFHNSITFSYTNSNQLGKIQLKLCLY